MEGWQAVVEVFDVHVCKYSLLMGSRIVGARLADRVAFYLPLVVLMNRFIFVSESNFHYLVEFT